MKLEEGAKPLMLCGQEIETVQDLARVYWSPEFEAAYTYYGDDLGVRLHKKTNPITSEMAAKGMSTTFALWAPLAEAVDLVLYATGSDAEEGAAMLGVHPMELTDRGVWRYTAMDNLSGQYYTYRVRTMGTEREVADPYSRAAGVNGLRSMVMDFSHSNPEGWEEDAYKFTKEATKALIWEIHIRDFSVSGDSGMQHKGKYLAFTERGTTVNGEGRTSTGVDYLRELGVTHVHLLPTFDYATVDEAAAGSEQYNWGYDPLNYNVPEGSYATDPYHGEVRIREFKEMVLALHRAGIGVIMDVVYNHTYHTRSSWFHQAVPYYYHRTTLAGTFGDATSCGNETASERSMMRLYLLDSLRFWAEEYHIDGFRFDLMGVHDVDTMAEVRSLMNCLSAGGPEAVRGKNLLVYGEPWSAACPSMPADRIPANMAGSRYLPEGVAVFSDLTRDTIKGSCFEGKKPGFVNGGIGLEGAMQRAILAYHTPDHPVSPGRTITYMSAHDNFTLWDKIYETVRGDGSGYDDPEMLRVAVNKLAAAILLTSQGIPFFQAGEEFGRTKYGEGNSYRSPSQLNALRWSRTESFHELSSYYRGLIAIRKGFSPFTDNSGKGADSIEFSCAENGVIAYTIRGQQEGEPLVMALIFNAMDSAKEVTLHRQDMALPTRWEVIANEAFAGTDPLYAVEGRTFPVHLRGVVIARSVDGI